MNRIVSHTHTHTHTYTLVARTVENAVKLNIQNIRGTEASWKLEAGPTVHSVSPLTHLAWENVMTDITRGGEWACSYRPGHPHRIPYVGNCPPYSGLDDWQEVGWEALSCRRQCSLCVLPRNLSPQNLQAPNVTFPHTVPLINQASKTNTHKPYVASESDTSNCAQRPPTTNVSHAMAACCQFHYRLIIGYGNSKIG